VMSITIACVGAVSVLHLAARNARPLAAVLAVGLVAAYVVNVSSYYHRWWVPQENLPAAIEYVLAHRDANDVVVVSFPSNYGFDAYWPGRDRTTYRVDPVSMGFVTRRPALDGVVYVEGLDNEHTDRAVRSAIDEARRRDATNVWILRSHFSTEEGIAWHQTFREFGLQPRLARIGYEALWVFAVPPAAEVRQ
jgi:hypothetical protein